MKQNKTRWGKAFFPLFTGAVLALSSFTTNAASTTFAVHDAVGDPACVPPGLLPYSGQALYLPNIDSTLPGIGNAKYVFAPGQGTFVENDNGTARLTGTVHSFTAAGARGFDVDVTFTGRSAAGMPMKELIADCYKPVGSIDPATWHYYTAYTGTLTGIGDYAGAVVSIVNNMEFQVGTGANGKNGHPGAAGWFTWTVTGGPATLANSGVNADSAYGDFNLDLAGAEGCPACYWKSKEVAGDKNNPSKWIGYTTDQKFKDIFVNAASYKDGGKKLKDSLDCKAGKCDKLGYAFKYLASEAVAALLNAAHPMVDYPISEADIIALVNSALNTCTIAALCDLATSLHAANSTGSDLCKPGTSGGGNCTTDGRPNKLTLTYNGGLCAAAVNSQPIGTKYTCTEYNGGPSGSALIQVRIILTASTSEPVAATARYFDGVVSLGGTFDVLSGASTFGANTYAYIYEGGLLRQRVGIHTSCSAPLIRGETFGGLTLNDYEIIP